MEQPESQGLLGLCINGNKLYFAISAGDGSGHLRHTGCMELTGDLPAAIRSGDKNRLEGVSRVIKRLRDNFRPSQVRMLTLPDLECWATFPKLVYDDSVERESHISVLMKGVGRDSVETFWFELSSRDHRFLALRNREAMSVFDKLLGPFPSVEYCSDFEIGAQWLAHTKHRGSFMTLALYDQCLCAASFMLGKLRGATFIPCSSIDDLPYFWLQQSGHLKWMKGLHEEVLVYGLEPEKLINLLRPYLDPSSVIVRMDNLASMKVEADEKTYGFSLEEAFPAIILSLGH
jgi:hypothetical protein